MFAWSPADKEWSKVTWRDKGWEFLQSCGRHQSTDWRSPVNFKDKVKKIMPSIFSVNLENQRQKILKDVEGKKLYYVQRNVKD